MAQITVYTACHLIPYITCSIVNEALSALTGTVWKNKTGVKLISGQNQFILFI